ncbi:MAG: ABC transporter permease subunit [Gammaproteobacteria bacterium]|nr:ABC transporter permease subunit [Gammaproteobacteria bacterium]MCH9762639.1 ABC transporter permease subunit [Gammaproteobacteria bacterium]
MKKWAQKAYVIFVYTLLYFPIFILVLYSFNASRFSLQWHGFSMHWYHELFQDSELWIAFTHSVILGVISSCVASIAALIVCVHLFLQGNKTNRSLQSTLLILIILPDLLLGIALLIFFNLTAIPLGFFSLLIAHITFCLPFSIIAINSRIHTLDINLYYSALDLGASYIKAVTHVLLPLLWPAVLSAFLLGFTLSFDDVIISYFVAGPDFNILPLTIYSLVRMGVTPELNALCSMTFIMSMLLVVFAYRLSRKV